MRTRLAFLLTLIVALASPSRGQDKITRVAVTVAATFQPGTLACALAENNGRASRSRSVSAATRPVHMASALVRRAGSGCNCPPCAR